MSLDADHPNTAATDTPNPDETAPRTVVDDVREEAADPDSEKVETGSDQAAENREVDPPV